MADLPRGKGYERGSDKKKVEKTEPPMWQSQDVAAGLARFDEDRKAAWGASLYRIDRQLVELNFYMRIIAEKAATPEELDEGVKAALEAAFGRPPK